LTIYGTFMANSCNRSNSGKQLQPLKHSLSRRDDTARTEKASGAGARAPKV
jgi:hypothetical protein